MSKYPDNAIHVVFGVYDPSGNYSQHAGVAITSIFENTSSKIVVHILHDDTLTEDNKKRFLRTADKYSQGLDLIDITEYKNNMNGKMKALAEKWTVGTLFRFAIPEVIETDKVIYLDCDLLFTLDIKELWDIDFDGKSLCAVLDPPALNEPRFSFRSVNTKLMGGNIKYYCNAGVLIMNLKKIRERGNFFDLVSEWFIRNEHLIGYSDQDAMNCIFFGDIKIIDAKYNYYQLEDADLSGRVIHLWPSKPWKFIRGLTSDKIYWNMYLLSAWGEGKTQSALIDEMLKDISMSMYEHKSPLRCLKRVCGSAYRAILSSNNIIGSSRALLRHMYYKFKTKRNIDK